MEGRQLAGAACVPPPVQIHATDTGIHDDSVLAPDFRLARCGMLLPLLLPSCLLVLGGARCRRRRRWCPRGAHRLRQ